MVVSIIPERIVGENEYNKQRGHYQFLLANQAKKIQEKLIRPLVL
jgi:hypothetical protein